jgi:CRISPR-associated protein Csb1
VEFTAEKIRAYFNLDLALIRGYGLPAEGYRLLVGLALLKVRRFVDGHLRLRTACDFGLAGKLRVNEPEGTTIPAEAELLASVQASIGECKGRFAEPAVTEVETPVKLVKGKKGEGDSEAAGDHD